MSSPIGSGFQRETQCPPEGVLLVPFTGHSVFLFSPFLRKFSALLVFSSPPLPPPDTLSGFLFFHPLTWRNKTSPVILAAPPPQIKILRRYQVQDIIVHSGSTPKHPRIMRLSPHCARAIGTTPSHRHPTRPGGRTSVIPYRCMRETRVLIFHARAMGEDLYIRTLSPAHECSSLIRTKYNGFVDSRAFSGTLITEVFFFVFSL